MNKKIVVMIFVMILMMMIPGIVFADSTGESSIKSAAQLKEAVNKGFEDGSLSESEKQQIIIHSSEGAIETLLLQKIDLAVDVLNRRELMSEREDMGNGIRATSYSYDLGDHCELVVELHDQEEGKKTLSVGKRATSGSNTLWKGYGNRYFTAIVSVKCNVATVNFQLENHYTLSSLGIDERYGVAFASCTVGNGILGKEKPVITDGSARTVGESDVNMYCIFSCKSGTVGTNRYKLNTTVKYIDHDKMQEKIKVGQQWNLVKV